MVDMGLGGSVQWWTLEREGQCNGGHRRGRVSDMVDIGEGGSVVDIGEGGSVLWWT